MGVVVIQKSKTQTTITVPLDKDLLTHEEALKFLAGTLEALRKGDLNPSRDLVPVLEIGLGVPDAQFSMENYDES